MDKTWITSNRFSESYLKGVKTFIEYATEHVLEVDNTFRCPCVKCNNASYKTPDLVERDLHVNGFNHSYVEWIFHGEEEYRVIGDDLNSSNNDEDNDVTNSSPIDEFDEFLGDLREAVASDNGDDDWLSELRGVFESDDDEEMKRFQNVFKNTQCELYPGCKMSLFSTVVRLLHLKVMGKWSNKSFTALLEFIKCLLLDGETLPSSLYGALKMLDEVGLGYEEIHACKNDCILYRKENKDAVRCPVCNESRWKFDNGKKKPHKILRYFPLIPRLMKLFMFRKTASKMRWHKEKRVVEEGVARHPADSLAWKHFDEQFPDFSADSRNIRLALATDGFTPWSNQSSSHSMWPVVLAVYNLPPYDCNPLLPVAPKFKKIPKPVASASNSRNVDTSPVVVSTLNSKSIAHTSSWGKKFKRIHKKTFTSNFRNVMDSEVTSPVASSPLMDQTDEHEEAMSPVASSPLMDQTDEPNGLNNSTEPNPERSAPCESDVSRASNKVRGVSRGLKLDKLVKKYGKMKIVFNPGETIPVDYEHEFSEGIGVSIRTCSELIGVNVWRDIPETNREVIRRCLMQWFEIEEWQTDRVKKIVNAKFQTSYRRWRHTLANCYLKLKEEGLDPKEKCPRDEVSMSKWHAVCDYIESGKFEDKSHKNSRSRSFLPYPHTGGRTSCLSRYKKMVQQSKIQLWRSNHVKKSGEFVNDAAKNTYEKMIEYETTSMEEGVEQMPEDDILVAALGRRSGYQKGMGYGVEVSRGTNSIAKTFELQAQLQSSNEKIENLTVQLGLQMEENKVNKEKITSLDAQLVENRNENESNKETINNLQAQMNQLMSIVNGLSASRNEGTLHHRN